MARRESRIRLLQNQAFFGGISDEVIGLILECSESIERSAGEYYFREDDEATSMYILEKGKVGVFKEAPGEPMQLRSLTHGDCFGEMALMDFMARSASVLALEDSRAMEIRCATLHKIFTFDIEQFALIQMNMGREVSRRLREADKAIVEQSTGNENQGAPGAGNN